MSSCAPAQNSPDNTLRLLVSPSDNAVEPTGSQARHAVSCRGLTRNYGTGQAGVAALRGVDLDVDWAEMLLLVGPSGCGKTTLISVLTGILQPSAGSVVVLGSDLPHLSSRELTNFRQKNIGFVFQQYNLLPSLKVVDNAAMPLIIAGVRRREALDRARAMLDSLGIGDRADKFPNLLSGGEQQRVAIARALIHNPRLVVCDEPTAALDSDAGRKIMHLLRAVAVQSDRAVIVVTHDPRVYEFGHRMAVMEDGRIVRIDAPELLHRKDLTQ